MQLSVAEFRQIFLNNSQFDFACSFIKTKVVHRFSFRGALETFFYFPFSFLGQGFCCVCTSSFSLLIFYFWGGAV